MTPLLDFSCWDSVILSMTLGQIMSGKNLPPDFPKCQKPQLELPKEIHRFVHAGIIPYITDNEEIRLLVLRDSLQQTFPPKILFTDDDVLREWLYKVPLPPPTQMVSWAGRTKEKIHISPKTYIGRLK